MGMQSKIGKSVFSIIAAIACFAAGSGHAQNQGAENPSPQPVASANNEAFVKLRAQCEAVGCSKTGGDVCADAAVLLLGEDLPNAYREMDKNQVRKIALRLLERGTDGSNRARAMAYDVYAGGGGFLLVTDPNKDPVRAVELLDQMVKSGYVPGIIRKLRSSLSIFSSNDKESVAACSQIRSMIAKGGLDRESLALAIEADEDTMRCPKPLQ